MFSETAPPDSSCALDNFKIIDLTIERFDQDGEMMKGSFEQELTLTREGSDLVVVFPNNDNAKTEFKFKIEGYLGQVLYHTSDEIEVTTYNKLEFV